MFSPNQTMPSSFVFLLLVVTGVAFGCSGFPPVEEVPLTEPTTEVSHLTVGVSVEIDAPDAPEASAHYEHHQEHVAYDYEPTDNTEADERRWATAIESQLAQAGLRVVGERGPGPMIELRVYVAPTIGPGQYFSMEEANNMRWELEMLHDGQSVDNAVWTAPYHVSSEGFDSRREAWRTHDESLATRVVNAMFESPRVTEIAREHAPSTSTTATASASEAAPSDDEAPSSQPEPDALDHLVAAPQPNAYALVVGVEDYRDLTPTPGARSDAERFAQMLEDTLGVPDQNIHLMTDERATRGDITSQLIWLKENVPSDGRIYFFFSGHGSPDVESGESYLLPYEGRPETINQTGLLMQEVLNDLEETEARDIIAFVDACFSGSGDRSSLPEGTRPLVPVQKTSTAPRVALLSSSAADEISGNAADSEEGLFTRHLLRAIGEGRADIDGDGQISLQELATYVTPRVAREARQLERNQTPSLNVPEGLGEPDNIILLWGLPRD